MAQELRSRTMDVRTNRYADDYKGWPIPDPKHIFQATEVQQPPTTQELIKEGEPIKPDTD
jgi:hypothetical protein